MNKKIHSMAVFIEFLAGALLAVFFHLVLNHAEVAYVIFGVGILLSLATWLLREDIDRTKTELSAHYYQAHELTFALNSITDPECNTKAGELLEGMKKTIALLQQGYVPLDESEFYLKGAKYAEESRFMVKAVDPITAGWDSRGALVNFYQSNLRALERGVQVKRIFVMNRDELQAADVQRVLASQRRDGVDVRIVFRDELPATSDVGGRDAYRTCDFALYDDKVITEVFPQSGRFFGRKTRTPAEVAKYLRMFELIEHDSHAVTEDNGLIVPA
ncbi:MAG: hypothetical protein NDI73_04545 [Desulfuromonadales bacterium]|nr:hypothetical protein [Desulfuromonadales bacterium]